MRNISKSLLCIGGCISFVFCLCNVSKYCFLFLLKVENKLYLHCMHDFHLCTRESALSA